MIGGHFGPDLISTRGNAMFTKELLESLFDLNLDTGDLFHKNGEPADPFEGRYRRVHIHGARYYAHHVVWCIIKGYWPEQIDHKNGDGGNNHPDNLRESNQSQNGANATWSPSRGVEAHGKKYRARITVEGKRISLGSYDTIEEAIKAYQDGAEKYFGEFAQHNRMN